MEGGERGERKGGRTKGVRWIVGTKTSLPRSSALPTQIIHRLSHYLIERSGGEDHWVSAVSSSVLSSNVTVRFVWGDSDAVAPSGIADDFSARVGGEVGEGEVCGEREDVAVIEGCGHFGMLEEPEKYTKEIKKALGV